MMFRPIFITLYILQNIFCTNAQKVITNPPHISCVPGTVPVICPFQYVAIVRNAFYGVSPVVGSCSYTIGDCIADATIPTCPNDDPCYIYFTRRKIPQCNDHFASYIHVEYDCVPISMINSTQEYDICQGGTDITSDHGIIKSPGYPTQIQATTNECFRAIHVRDDQTIRLWLSDLYIGSTSTNCADDHLYVVDSIQTYRYCGIKRYAYPYLCSSTIIIQYFITTAYPNYRGMRMYFEIADRSTNDGCPNPNGTVTPVPATTPPTTTIDPDLTTNTPIYVTLGIASPVRSLQLCTGDSYRFECPNNYVLTIIRNIFGTTPSDQCEPYDATKHCVSATDPTIMCQQSCTYMYTGHYLIPSCNNKTAAYQYIEYQCIPTNTNLITNTPCSSGGPVIPINIGQNGRFQSYNYPNLQITNCTYRLTASPGNIMHFYSLDISLNGFVSTCQSNKLTLIENAEKPDEKLTEFCEQRTVSLIYSSCSNELDLMYTITNAGDSLSKGVELYIESQARPSDWTCGQPLPTPPPPTIIPTAPFTTPTATPLKNETFMAARDEIEHDICWNDTLSYTCPSGYTFMILSAYYGVKSSSSNKCGFVQNDCTQDALSTITQCRNDLPNCYLTYTLKRRLAYCSDNYADYLHITSQCIPSKDLGSGTAINVYDICETNDDIRNFNGIITSTNFPTFQQTNKECKRAVIDIQDRVLKIWLNELAIPSGGQRILNDDLNSNEPDLVVYKNDDIDNLNDVEQMFPSIRDICIADYLMINTPHVAYIFCGTRKLALEPICAKSVNIHYIAASQPSTFYKGFKLYFEWVEKPVDVICGGTPSEGNTTTPTDEPLPIWAQNLELSPILSEHLCLGTSTTLRCPRGSDYVLSIIDSSYGVSGSGLCEIPTSSHCRQDASLSLPCAHSCFIEYNIPKQLVQCGSQNADYLNIDYECIPTRLPNHENPIDICASTTTDTIAIDTGMMISPQYPTLGAARICSKKIQTLQSKLWMVFIVDLHLEGENFAGVCDSASLTINDGKDQIIRCGSHQPELVLISCSDIIEFKFISTHYALGYRGFKVYFKTVDVPADWACKPNNYTTLPMTTTPQPPITTTLLPPSVQIWAYGGTTNGSRPYCKFPFIYQGQPESTCSRADPPSSTGQDPKEPWCSLTSNFDIDRQWGFCHLGVTDPTIYDVCRDKSQFLQCPSGYVIDIITADYAAKPDGSIGTNTCTYDRNDCFQSDAPSIQTACAGLTSCTVYHMGRPLPSCQNRQSAYFHIDYTCIPNDIPEINTFDMCGSSVLPDNTRRGFIVSPNYPTPHTNIDCTFDLRILKAHQDIYLYLIEMDLNGPNVTGQNCVRDRLIVTADNTMNEMCGRAYTNFLVYTCHESVLLRLIRTPAAAGGHGVKFYFEFRDKPPAQLCPSLISTTTMSTLSPPLITTTTPGPKPSYFPDPSPRMLKTLCYPDLSGLLGVQNFQCPSDYVIVIHRAFYGKGTRCDYTSGDCTTEADIIYRTCAGKQSCSVSFLNLVILPECSNAVAEYLFVEYQCLPSPTVASNKGDLCQGKIDHAAGVSGLFKSLTYPTYTPEQCANNTLSSLSSTNLVIYMYLLDFNIGSPNATGQCSNDYLLLSYQCNNQLYSQRLCGTHPTKLLFSTCQPTDQIFASYNLLGQDPQVQHGFALLYHLLPKSEGASTITTPGIPTTTHAVTDPITIPGPGPISTSIEQTTACVPQAITIQCNTPGYVLIIHRVQLGVSATNSCTYSPNDCFEDHTTAHNYCGGQTQCYLFPSEIPINACNNSRANYLYAEHQCIPTRPKLNLDVCLSGTGVRRVEGGAMVSLLNYTSENTQCAVTLRSDKLLGSDVHKAFKIYILSLNLPTRPILREQGAQCSDTDPYIDIDDHELAVTRLCGNSHTRYLLETCSTMIETRFNNIIMPASTEQYRGFEIYFESIQNDECLKTIAPPIQTPPFVIKNEIACALINGSQRVDFSCTPHHGLVFLQSYQFVTEDPKQCDVTRPTCFYPNEQPQAQCAGQEACSYTHITPAVPESTVCQDKPSDSVEFYYQCLPMIPLPEYARYIFCSDESISTKSGFIETPAYPNTYQHGTQNCSFSIQLPNDADNENDSIYLYIIESSIRDTSIMNSSSAVKCFDSIKYTDGDKTDFLCGKIDQPLLKYHTNKKQLNLTLNIPHSSSESEWSIWHGARLFFYIGNQSLPSPPILPPLITTTPDVDNTSTEPNPGSSNAGLIAAIVVVSLLAVLAVLLGFAYYRRRSESRANEIPAVKYDADMGTIDGGTVHEEAEKRTSIPVASLKGSAFLSPFYSKPETNGKQEIENETTA